MSADIEVAERIDPEELRDAAKRLLADQAHRREGLQRTSSEPSGRRRTRFLGSETDGMANYASAA